MPLTILTLYCRDCGRRGEKIVDRRGRCTVCNSINVVRWYDMGERERRRIETSKQRPEPCRSGNF